MKHRTDRWFKKTALCVAAAAGLSLSACSTVPASKGLISVEPVIAKTTTTQVALQRLPPPSSKITVAVYGFDDKTGQFKPTEAGQTLSRAVSQGGDEVLIKALHDAGLRSWFTVIERSNLNNLLKERQIISEMRSRYLGETTVNSKALPPLLFAGVIFEGGIVGFDTNTVTGGVAARYLGIGGRTDYRQNVVTVHLRAVSVKTGEVLASVTTEKTIASVGISANVFRFVTFDNLLEADAGVTSNEPGLLALRQAVEKSVYALVMEGTEIGLWDFADRTAGLQLLNEYQAERGNYQISSNALSAKASNRNFAQLDATTNTTKKVNKPKLAQPMATKTAKATPAKTIAKTTSPVKTVAPQKVVSQKLTARAAPTQAVPTQPVPTQAMTTPAAKQPAVKPQAVPTVKVVSQEAAAILNSLPPTPPTQVSVKAPNEAITTAQTRTEEINRSQPATTVDMKKDYEVQIYNTASDNRISSP
ncbi:CsgG/HfaB family protein [Litorimonas sp. RW-G-Af-16]|uniref:CsgG/HfaB family protein n=1 Tax=Litorimonas sp. RW-G-Af-16 TaxID=3241168 RepID=UPI003AAD7B8C